MKFVWNLSYEIFIRDIKNLSLLSRIFLSFDVRTEMEKLTLQYSV